MAIVSAIEFSSEASPSRSSGDLVVKVPSLEIDSKAYACFIQLKLVAVRSKNETKLFMEPSVAHCLTCYPLSALVKREFWAPHLTKVRMQCQDIFLGQL